MRRPADDRTTRRRWEPRNYLPRTVWAFGQLAFVPHSWPGVVNLNEILAVVENPVRPDTSSPIAVVSFTALLHVTAFAVSLVNVVGTVDTDEQ